MSRIAVALSGGVDSSTTAALLQKEGHEVFGVTMRLCESEGAKVSLDYAKRACDQLKIEHYVFDFKDQFSKDVIDYFKSSYINGVTPNPCAKCNRLIKFGLLFDSVSNMGAEALATGHYVRTALDKDGEVGLYKGVDMTKDQSYFLFGVKREILKSLVFPLGDKRKTEVRRLAAGLGLCTADRKESQDICFIPSGDYKSVLGRQPNPGDIVDTSGSVIGRHAGLWNYTIGQRKGLGVSGSKPLFVVDMDPENNRLIVGEQSKLEYSKFQVQEVNWLVDPERLPQEASVKTRYAQSPMSAKIIPLDGKSDVIVELKQPAFALSPGQFAVFYSEDRVLGGGCIYGKYSRSCLFNEGANLGQTCIAHG
ncbi:MAG: tRNA 2-thiouridine(34) synthase MnmA [Holosporales bacterium]|nr:tRNA 2-thiouridine(34) synthase MnmA [Holosporales bacterium]